MSILFIISLNLAKIAALFGGTALPGWIGLKLNPALINQSVKKNRLRSIVITGTNGKTTTSRLLGQVLTLAEIDFIHNRSGSNLLRGIATTLINQSDWQGRIKSKLAVWEVDEATLPAALTALKPKIVLFTNLSRDQLDRYGEVDTLLNAWQKSLRELPPTSWAIVNGADRRLCGLTHPRRGYFGKRQAGYGLKYPSRFNGKVNYDSLWAVEAIAGKLKLDPALVPLAAGSLPAVFGRGETFSIKGKNYQINLVKNPASFKAVWQMVLDRRHLNQPLLLLLNDRLADGTDVSWIWDVPLTGLNRRRRPVIVGGSRAFDLGLRLKYAGLKPALITVEPNPAKAFNRLSRMPGNTRYILPTYTAMLSLRRWLGKEPWN